MLLEFVVFIARILTCFSETDKRVITSFKYSRYRVQLTVVNGTPAEHWQVPYLVSIKEPVLRKENLIHWGNLCGASIISRDGKLLTAAHCFEANKFFYAKRPNILRAVTGSTQTDIESTGISGISKGGVQWRKLIKAILHHQFVFPENDIAIVLIDAPWDYKKGIEPIALATRTEDRLGDCYLAGYGRIGHTERDGASEVLLLGKVETMSRHMCSELWNMPMDHFICTTTRLADASQGDSGGPLWCEYPHGRELAGIVSGKNFDKTTLFTRVSLYTNWIQNDYKTTEFKNGSKSFEFSYGFTICAIILIFCLASMQKL